MVQQKTSLITPTIHCAFSTIRFSCLLAMAVSGLLSNTSAQVTGQTACVPMPSDVHPPSLDTLDKLSQLERRYGPVLGINGYLSRSCSGEMTGPGHVASPRYPCQPSWNVDDDDRVTACVWRVNAAPAAGSHGLGRLRLDHMTSASSQLGTIILIAFDSFPPTLQTQHVNLTDPLSNTYLNFRDAATVVLISTGRIINRTKFLLNVSVTSPEVDTSSSTLTTTESVQDIRLIDSKKTCVPLRSATYGSKQISEETRNLATMYLALYKGDNGAAVNLSCLEERRGSGLIISRNYPCNYPDFEVCAWVLYAEDVPHNSTSNPITTNTRGGRSSIRLRFESFVTEPTYDQLLVAFPAPPPTHYTLYRSLSGNLMPNYTLELDSKIVCLIFTTSKATTASGFRIDFTTVVEEGPADPSNQWSTANIATAVSVAAVMILGAAVVTCIAYKRRFTLNREKSQKHVENSVAYTARPDTAAYINKAMPKDALSYKDGLVFGGWRRPDVLLVYCEDDRTHCAVVESLAQLLRSLGGCEVRTISATQHSQLKPNHNGRSAAIRCDQLHSAARQADRMIVFVSRGAELVQEAFRCGKVYPRLYRTSAAYLAIPQAVQLCTSCSAVRAKTLVVVYDFREDGCQGDVNGSVANSDGSTSSSHRSSIVRQLGANVPEFRLLEDMPRLVAAIHSVTQDEAAAANSSCPKSTSGDVIELLIRAQAPIIWSCSEEYEASNERRQLISCVAAVEKSAMQGVQGGQLFEAAHGPAVDWLDQTGGLMGSVGAVRLSGTAESRHLSIGGLTDVVTIPSLTGLCASSDSGVSEVSEYIGFGGSSSQLLNTNCGHIGSDEQDSSQSADGGSSLLFS